MTNKIFAIPLVILAVLLSLAVYDFYGYIVHANTTLLSTPYGNNIMGLARNIPENFYYFRSGQVIYTGRFTVDDWLFAISPNLSAIVFFLLSSLFIVFFARLRRLEKSFLVFAYSICGQYIFFMDYVSQAKYIYVFYFFTFASNGFFIYLVRTIFARKTKIWVHASGILLSLGISFLFYPNNAAQETQLLLYAGFAHLFAGLYGVYLLLSDLHVQSDKPWISSAKIRRVLALAASVILIMPGAIYILTHYFDFQVTLNKNIVFYLPAAFPMLFLFSSLRGGFTYFEIPVSSGFLRFVYFVYFAFLYIVLVGFQADKLIESGGGQIIINLLSVLAFVFVFDILRSLSFMTIHRFFIFRRAYLNEGLSEFWRHVHNVTDLTASLESAIDLIKLSVGSTGIGLIISDRLFQGWSVKRNYLFFLDDEDPLWYQLEKQSYWKLNRGTFTTKDSGPVQDFLQSKGGFLIMPFQKLRAAIMLYEKQEKEPYYTEDIAFIKKLILNAEPMLENYKLLINNLQLRRMEEELIKVSSLQKGFLPKSAKETNISFHTFSKPSRLVTGDYVDILQAGKDSYIIFLGDVSGHSLASAYFMTTIRSMIHGYYESGANELPGIFSLINDVLYSRQSSMSFMTLCGLQIRIEKRSEKKKNPSLEVHIEMVNAGQHAPIIYSKSKKSLMYLSENQPLLGAVKKKYHSMRKIYRDEMRILLCSDGAFEIFNEEGEILGEKGFLDWVAASIEMSPQEQIDFLYENINQYSAEPNDDISILITEIVF